MNKALRRVFRTALAMSLGPGKYILDGYNDIVIVSGISLTITTRIDASSNVYLLDIYE